MKIKQITEKGNNSTVDVEISDDVWGVPMNKDLVVQAVNVYLDNQRKGTAQAKTRSDVRGGGKKPWRQKGTGRARHGSIRSPLWVGGGVVFGPSSYKKVKNMPKKMKRGAVKCALSQKLKDEEILMLNSFAEFDKPSTKKMQGILDDLDLTGSKVMFILPSEMESFKVVLQSGRNLKSLKIKRASDVNIFDVLDAEKIVILSDAVKELEERLT
jgi:large subunit ribosomal protein L4